MIAFSYRELCLIVQSIQSLDWSYSGEEKTAESVIRKCQREAQRLQEAECGK